MDDQRLEACKSVACQIASMLEGYPNGWETYLTPARGVMAVIDAISSIDPTDWVWVVEVLQNFAFAKPDEGVVSDIEDWCYGQWFAMLGTSTSYWPAFRGLGQLWLYRAQPALARIREQEQSSSSSGERCNGHTSSSEEEARIETPEYVEARQLLIPCIENYAEAVGLASAQGALSGHLLEQAAEAYMNLGNVTSSQSNQQYFFQAVRYLQMTRGIAGYQMPQHWKDWLEKHSQLME